MQIIDKNIDELMPYEKNPRKNDAAVDKVTASIQEFGFKVPIVVDKDNVIAAGHTRYKAAKKLGLETVPCIIADDLTEEQINAFRLADNKTAEFAGWDFDMLSEELKGIEDIDMEQFGFDDQGIDNQQKHFWGDIKGAETQEYNDFVDKFKPKLTTDDCYTPEPVYEAAKDWAVKEYGLEGARIIRPFYPNGDYQSEDYSGDCAVIDNPPFSILSEIACYYMERNIRFFLFAPMLTLFSTAAGECNYVVTKSAITYENGAEVNTAFITNLGDYKVMTSIELSKAITEANGKGTGEVWEYEYPKNVITSSRLGKYVCSGVDVRIKNASFIRALDEQKKSGKGIFGSGFLISDEVADKIQADFAISKAKIERGREKITWNLSDKEKAVVLRLNEIDRSEKCG